MNSVWNKIPAMLIIILIACLFINHSVKKNALENSIDEDLVKELIVGSYVEVGHDTDLYTICTEENIERLEIDKSSVSMGLFGPSASVSYNVDLYVGDLSISTNGRLGLEYSDNSPCHWVVTSRWIDSSYEILD